MTEISGSIFVCTFLVSLFLNYSFQKLSIHFNKIDEINHRSSHKNLATKTGGISFFSSVFLITFYYYYIENEVFDFSLLLPLSIIFIIGVYDDFYDADFKLKFFIQIIVAKQLIDNGFVIDNFYGLFGLHEVSYFIAQITTVFVFLIIVNSFNFIDGIDGLAISFSIMSIFLFDYFSTSNIITNLNTLIILSLLPLFYYNFRKTKKVFLGDAGSLVLGSLVAMNTFGYLNTNTESTIEINKAITSIAILFYPLFDLLRVFIIRISNGKSPFNADQNHLHHFVTNKIKNHFLTTILIVLANLLVVFLIISL